MANNLIRKIRRGLKKPPRVIAQRVLSELVGEAERFLAPVRARRLDERRLLRELGFAQLDPCWAALAKVDYATAFDAADARRAGANPMFDCAWIFDAAHRAMAFEVDLMGSGPVVLGPEIDWHKDYKTGMRWAPAYCRSIAYNNLDQPSDVKFPWELSRLQWLIPVGQAYHLTGDEKYAQFARDILTQWIDANPYAHSVNWACTMEVALRVLSWTWFFHIFHASDAWTDAVFRFRFLRMVYLHGDFTARHLEKSDINGNHYTADAAGLAFAGLFFGGRGRAARWQQQGWQILCDEMPLQVFPDGVDFEASVPYHRLVLELFLFPAIYRVKAGLDVPHDYRERLCAMARFTAAYSRPDGSVPLWGDADDARALPMGSQAINDHRYLPALVGAALGDQSLQACRNGDMSELPWWLGPGGVRRLVPATGACAAATSVAFPDGGFFIMRNALDHVFIDCGPLGLAGRGGHGHNDALSFEAVLCGAHLVTDSGAYLYTADYRARNRFRSTASHNTPMVDGEEINRFIRPDYLWNMHNDARAEMLEWQPAGPVVRFKGHHHAYRRLSSPLVPMRTIELDARTHALTWVDEFEGDGTHRFEIPLHLAVGVVVTAVHRRGFELTQSGQQFVLEWSGDAAWTATVEPAHCSPSYGRLIDSFKIVWRCQAPARQAGLAVCLRPATRP